MSMTDTAMQAAATPLGGGASQGGYYPINTFVKGIATRIHQYMAESFHTKGAKSDYSPEWLADIERAIASQLAGGADHGSTPTRFEYRGHDVAIYDEATWGCPAAVIDERNRCPIDLVDLAEGEFLDAIDDRLAKRKADAIRYTGVIWGTFDLLPAPDAPALISRGRVTSFRNKAADSDMHVREKIDAADRAVAADPSEAMRRFLDCLFSIGYVGMAGEGDRGDWLACVQAPKDPSHVMFARLTPEGGFDCAAMFLDEAPGIWRSDEDLKGSFFDTKENTLTGEGVFCAVKRWGSARTTMPVSRMLAEFCCFDKEACRFLYGPYGVPRWRKDLWNMNRSIWPNFKCEAVDPYFCWIGNVHHTLRVRPELLPYELETADYNLEENCEDPVFRDAAYLG